jgi:uncharacterized protein (DUF2267 family)
METDEFIRLVQAALPNGNGKPATKGDVLRAIGAILRTLGEVLQPKQIQQLMATLPPEIGNYLFQVETNRYDTLNEFFQNVAAREGTTLPYAIHHSRIVIAVLQKAIPSDVLQTVRAQLPHEFAPLFQ